MARTSHMDESKVVIQMKDIVKKCGNAVYDLSLAVKNAHGTIVRRK